MGWIEFALPGALLLTKFLLKLFVDRAATAADAISAVLALPVDIVFLAASLLAAYALTSSENLSFGLVLCLLCICLSLLVVVLWRRSETQFTRDQRWRSFGIGLCNILLSASALIYSMNLLSSVGRK